MPRCFPGHPMGHRVGGLKRAGLLLRLEQKAGGPPAPSSPDTCSPTAVHSPAQTPRELSPSHQESVHACDPV